jgi:hypothetical protein
MRLPFILCAITMVPRDCYGPARRPLRSRAAARSSRSWTITSSGISAASMRRRRPPRLIPTAVDSEQRALFQLDTHALLRENSVKAMLVAAAAVG